MSENEYSHSIEHIRSMTDGTLINYENKLERLRRKAVFDVAIREYRKVYPEFLRRVEDTNSNIDYAKLSKVEFEIGYIDFLICEFDEAIQAFEKSAQSSLKANDHAREEIANFRVIHTQYVAGVLLAKQAHELMVASRDRFYALSKQYRDKGNDTEASRCDNWVYNVQGRLFDVVSNDGNIELSEKYYTSFLNDSSTIDLLSQDPPEITRMIEKLSKEGRVAYVKENYQEALESFSQYLQSEPLLEYGQPEKDYAEYAHTSSLQELSRDYLFAGKSLIALDKSDASRQVLADGKKIDSKNGNLVFHRKIDELLKIL